jgi:hypothetical protein
MTNTASWIVMTSAAKMPSSCRRTYRNVALVQVTSEYLAQGLRPKMISEHARGVAAVRHMGHHSVGKTSRSAYARAVAEAEVLASQLNGAGV